MNLPKDAEARKRALNTDESFAVSAPAGSGKTGLLTQRVLALLAICEQPENILAITFTKKAAAEMQNRILAALTSVKQQIDSNQAPPENEYDLQTWQLAQQVLKRDQEQKWHLLSLPNRLRITTIDGFCRQISQQMPLINGMGAAPQMLEGEESNHAYLLAARETLELLEKKSTIQQDLIQLTQYFNNNLTNIETLFISLLKRRDQWLGSLLSVKEQRLALETTLLMVIEQHLEALFQELLPYAGELIELADYAAQYLSNNGSQSSITRLLGLRELPEPKAENILLWQALTEMLLTQKDEIRSRLTKTNGFPSPDKKTNKEDQDFVKNQKDRAMNLLYEIKENAKLVRLLAQAKALPNSKYSDEQWNILDNLTRVLTQLVAHLYLVFQQLGKTDFIQITQSALTALGHVDEPSDLALILDYQIQHILVDEFQDTSSPQLELLNRLSAGWQKGDGKTLFLVGDAMQSCYSFREANVGIFLDIRKNGLNDIALTSLDLTVNFRSQENLVEWCNSVFESLFPLENSINEGAVKYLHADAFNPALHTKAVSTHLFSYEEKVNTRSEEALKIIDIIKQEQTSSNTIAILVRKRSQVNEITQVLNDSDIRYNATELDSLKQSMVVQDLLSLTRALLYPNDRIAWLAILRAPWCGLNMSDLYEFANTSIETCSLVNLLLNIPETITFSNDGKKRLKRFSDNISHIFEQQSKLTLDQWIESAWLQLGGDALLLDDEEKKACITYFKSLRKYQQAGRIKNWRVFSESVNNLYNINSQKNTGFFEATLSDNNSKAIEIMTIHKSKGLEFDTVIIPGLDISSRGNDSELISWLEWIDKQGRSRLLISPINATGDEKDKTYNYIQAQQKHKQELESDRLFYVACTRAIKNLFLLGYVNNKVIDDSNKENKPPSKTSILGRIWNSIISSADVHTVKSVESKRAIQNQGHHSHNSIIRLTDDWVKPSITDSQLLKKYRLNNHFIEKLDDNIAKPDALLQREKRYFGILLHSALQAITETNVNTWDKKRIDTQAHFWLQRFLQWGIKKDQSQLYTAKICKTLSSILEGEIAPWLLNNKHKDSHCELSLWSKINDTIKESIVDRTFIDVSTNTRWIVDYKSSEPNSDQSLDTFLTEESKQYHHQLEGYKTLFQHENINTTSALYFPTLDILHKINT